MSERTNEEKAEAAVLLATYMHSPEMSRKVAWIRAFRCLTGLGLKQAKDAYEIAYQHRDYYLVHELGHKFKKREK
jgi:ribosomal protein L7/L12